MAPELRKRKAPPPAPEPPKKKAAPVKKAAAKAKETKDAKEAVKTKAAAAPAPTPAPAPAKTNGAASKKVAVGDTVDLASFGGEVTLNDGTATTLADLVEKSGSGVVLFTYPKASTPGCTTQACLFRDSYEPLTKDGLAIYGLSRDSPKSNTTFKEKQKLSYPLLCDPKATLISAIGLSKAPSSTQRGVFVIDKKGKVLLAEPGSPAGTVAAVKKLVEAGVKNGEATKEKEDEKTNGDAAEEAKADETEEKKKNEEEEEKKDDEKEEKDDKEEKEEEEKEEEAEKEEKEEKGDEKDEKKGK